MTFLYNFYGAVYVLGGQTAHCTQLNVQEFIFKILEGNWEATQFCYQFWPAAL